MVQAAQIALWQHALGWLGGVLNLQTPLRPLDERKVIWLLQDLYAVGERPSYRDVKSYLDELWPAAPESRRMVRDIWRTVLRNPQHKFRVVQRERYVELYSADLIINESGIGPPLEERVDAVLHDTADGFMLVAYLNPDPREFREARAAMDAAVKSVVAVRRLRYGKAACNEWFFDDEPYSGGPIRPR